MNQFETIGFRRLWREVPSIFDRVGNRSLITSAVFNSAFGQGQIGWAYDLHDDSTLFTDSAGTTPATLEDPIGLQLDKSQGLKLGPELVTNGTFDEGLTGYTTNRGTFTPTIVSEFVGQSNVVRTNSDTPWEGLETVISTEAGSYYEIKYLAYKSLTGSDAGNLNVYDGDLSATEQTSAGFTQISGLTVAGSWQSRRGIFRAQSSLTTLLFGMFEGGDVYFDNIFVRELPGNHRFQSVSADRPILSARYNQLTKTEDFADAAWQKFSCTVIADAATDPDGTATADKIVPNNGSSGFVRQITGATGVYTYSVKAKAGEWAWLYLFTSDGIAANGASFDLQNGSVGSVGPGLTATIAPSANGFFICSVSRNYAGTEQQNRCYPSNSNGSADTGDGTSGIYLWGASLLPAQEASLPYQRVNTATDYDGDKTKFPRYLSSNGSNQWMKTATLDFTSSDKIAVFAGVRKLDANDAGRLYCEFSASQAANGVFQAAAPGGSGANHYAFISKGTAAAQSEITSGYLAPISNVLGTVGDINGDLSAVRLDGIQVAQSTADQGTGNYGAYPLYFFSRAGSSLFFKGREYSSIGRLGPITDAEINAVEKYIAGRVPGVTV